MTQDCIFCKIAAGAIPAKIIYRDEHVVAFHDVNPQAPVHMLIIPIQHIESLAAVKTDDEPLLGHLLGLAPQMAALAGIDRGGYRTVLNTGRDAGMAVYHLHVHVLGGRHMAWPPG